MNQTTNSIVLASLLAILFIFIPFADDADLMFGIQSAKTFYFAYAMLALALVGLVLWVVTKNVTVELKPLDVLLGSYFAYSCLHPFLFGYYANSISWLENISLAALYLLVRRVSLNHKSILLYAVVLAGIAQAIYGSMQLYGFSHSNHSLYNITGSFFNPGPYAGYLAGIFPIALFYYWVQDELIITKNRLLTYRGLRNVSLKFIPLVALISILLVLPASHSRAAWLGALAGSVLVAWHFRKKLVGKLRFRLNKPQKHGVLIIGILLLAMALTGLYKFKQSSADGRLLIWKVAGKMVNDKPIWGHGIDQFAAQYMNYQANYFKPIPKTPEAMRADNVLYVYNELLKLLVEKGLVGLLLAIAILWVLFFVKTTGSGKAPSLVAARGGLLAILVFAMFGYPSEILPIKILFVVLIAIVSLYQQPLQLPRVDLIQNTILDTHKTKNGHRVVNLLLLSLLLMAIYPVNQQLQRLYQGYTSWKDASDIYNVNAYVECLDDFKLAYPVLKTNGNFLVQYGKAFEMAQKPDSAIVLLTEAKQYLNNTIMCTTLGNSYKALAQYERAEVAYMQACYMAPARFYPLYLLAKLYDDTNQTEKALNMAKRVLNKEVKIDSQAIEEIKEEMQNIIEQAASLKVDN